MTSAIAAYARFDHSRDLADQVAERFEEAGRTLSALPASGTRPSAKCVNWPDIVADAEDLSWLRESDAMPPAPTSAQVARMDEALSWLSLIDDADVRLRRVICMRLIVHPISGMNRWSWDKIGAVMGSNKTSAKRWHRRGCEIIGKKIAQSANSSSLLSVFAVF